MIDDMFSLLAWCKDEELKAHNNSYDSKTFAMKQCWDYRRFAFRDMINHIENSPIELHRTLTMPREFDVL
jgi:hypothetical protein